MLSHLLGRWSNFTTSLPSDFHVNNNYDVSSLLFENVFFLNQLHGVKHHVLLLTTIIYPVLSCSA